MFCTDDIFQAENKEPRVIVEKDGNIGLESTSEYDENHKSHETGSKVERNERSASRTEQLRDPPSNPGSNEKPAKSSVSSQT